MLLFAVLLQTADRVIGQGQTDAWGGFGAMLLRFETRAVWWAQLIKLVVGFGLLMAIRSGLKAPLIALLGGNAAVAGGVRYLLVVLFAGCVWPLTFWWFGRLGRR